MSAITWTPELDARVVDGIARGLSRSQIAAELGDGFTRNMVIARHARIRGIVFPSDEARGRQSRERAAVQALARMAHVSEQLAEMDRLLARGLRRNYVIALARRSGLHLEEVGQHIGITRERVRQICEVEPVARERA